MTTAASPARSPLLAVAPIIGFLVANRLGGLRLAVLVATVAAIAVAADRRRQGLPLGRFLPIITAALIARGVVGIATDSETVYFGLGIAGKYAIAAVLAGSVAIARPLAAKAMPLLVGKRRWITVQRQPHWRGTMIQLTAIVAVYYAVSASVDVYLLRNNDAEGFVLWRFLATWPLTALALFGAYTVFDRGLRQAGMDPVHDLLERRMAELDRE